MEDTTDWPNLFPQTKPSQIASVGNFRKCQGRDSADGIHLCDKLNESGL